jgi:hypothetical protein
MHLQFTKLHADLSRALSPLPDPHYNNAHGLVNSRFHSADIFPLLRASGSPAFQNLLLNHHEPRLQQAESRKLALGGGQSGSVRATCAMAVRRVEQLLKVGLFLEVTNEGKRFHPSRLENNRFSTLEKFQTCRILAVRKLPTCCRDLPEAPTRGKLCNET